MKPAFKKALSFMKDQKLLSIASCDGGDVWCANVYMSISDEPMIYFVSSKDTRHGKLILKNPQVSFSTAWYDHKNLKNRKGIQGLGICREANLKETAIGIKLMYKNFPDLRDILTLKWITDNAWNTRVWVIRPSYIKYFDDEIYGDDESEEFNIK